MNIVERHEDGTASFRTHGIESPDPIQAARDKVIACAKDWHGWNKSGEALTIYQIADRVAALDAAVSELLAVEGEGKP